MKKSTFLNLFLFASYFFLFSNASFGQIRNESSKNNLPSVSNEAYKAIAQFYDYDDLPLEASVINKKKFPFGKREKIVFTGVNNSRVPAYLCLPENGASSYPVVLIIDGIYGSKERWFEDQSWPKGALVIKALLDKGFAIMILDAVYHGERSAENDYRGPSFKYPNTARDMIIQTAIEYRRSMDYLSTRKDIDTTQIGVLGLSMGGLITFQLASIDSRIKTAIAGLTPLIKEPKFEPVLATTFASHISCDSFLMFMGNMDRWYTIEEARQLYGLIPISNKKFIEYNVGHDLPDQYIEKVTQWFEKYLKS